ncbi:MAG: hypothetical protein VX938_03895 [Myxococcota bacterium]|nr:hypothetical protein [Myxococcota bacterium]MEE2779221.1 hypothetical protein [Myxococcota bacterium]
MLRKGGTDGGLALVTVLPTRPNTFLVAPQNQAIEDLHLRPLPHVVGWYRQGMKVGEVQASFQVPGFVMGGGFKLPLLGRQRDARFSLAVSTDVASSPMLAQFGTGLSVHATVRPRPTWAMDLTVRGGVSPGLWTTGAVTVLGGVTLGRTRPWRVMGGAIIDPGTGASPGAYLGIGKSL